MEASVQRFFLTLFLSFLVFFVGLGAYSQTPVPTTLNWTTSNSSSNTGSSVAVNVTAQDLQGITSITISLDNVVKQTCTNPALNSSPYVCNTTVTWNTTVGSHIVSTTATTKSGLLQSASTTFPN